MVVKLSRQACNAEVIVLFCNLLSSSPGRAQLITRYMMCTLGDAHDGVPLHQIMVTGGVQ